MAKNRELLFPYPFAHALSGELWLPSPPLDKQLDARGFPGVCTLGILADMALRKGSGIDPGARATGDTPRRIGYSYELPYLRGTVEVQFLGTDLTGTQGTIVRPDEVHLLAPGSRDQGLHLTYTDAWPDTEGGLPVLEVGLVGSGGRDSATLPLGPDGSIIDEAKVEVARYAQAFLDQANTI